MSYRLSLNRFIGRLAVVTGASSGIGKAIAECLVKQGVKVAGLAGRLHRLNNHATQLDGGKSKLYPYKCDLTKQEEILSTFRKITSELGAIHILINNADMKIPDSIIEGDIEKWEPDLDANLLSLAVCTKEAITSMKAHNIKGHIININSIVGHKADDIPEISIYPATRHAITGLTDALRSEIIRENLPIKITSLSLGYVKREVIRTNVDGEDLSEKNGITCLETEDIADAILFILATPEHVNVKEVTVTIQEKYL